MEKFTTVTGIAAPIPLANIDTDMIIPARYLKTIKRTGLAEGLFANLRSGTDRTRKEFILDQPPYDKAKVLVTGENFGCGSSREHAPWALLDAGIRVIIASSFADIFYNNCFKNGILPIVLTPEEVAMVMDDAERGDNARITVDLESQTITGPDGGSIAFDIDPYRKHCLLNGLDDIGLTLAEAEKIDSFEAQRKVAQPWL
ncbi:MAG: 3-isopropylmalate dehydratase small subunit [Pseudomonadota bacterium]